MNTILVIDDNESILVSLTYVLKTAFRRVITLNGPERALSTLQQETVDVILLDMNFSFGVNDGAEGLYWLQTIREQHPGIPVVLFTAYAEIDLAVRGIKMGASDFIVKPWDNERLIATLQMAVDKQNTVVPLSKLEESHIRTVIDKCYGNLTQAAELLGVTRQTLYNKLKNK